MRLLSTSAQRIQNSRSEPHSGPMKYTRRGFLEVAGAIVAVAGSGCSRQPDTARRSGATGVELNVENGALPDYSRDLERYLVRVAGDARARRKQVVDSIATPQRIQERQKEVTEQVWKMLGGPFEQTP